MIQQFNDLWFKHSNFLRVLWDKNPPDSYQDIFETLVRHVLVHGGLDPSRITVVDDCPNYSGTMTFHIPNHYGNNYAVSVTYGSCSYCDSFEACTETSDYMSLALHMVQALNKIDTVDKLS